MGDGQREGILAAVPSPAPVRRGCDLDVDALPHHLHDLFGGELLPFLFVEAEFLHHREETGAAQDLLADGEEALVHPRADRRADVPFRHPLRDHEDRGAGLVLLGGDHAVNARPRTGREGSKRRCTTSSAGGCPGSRSFPCWGEGASFPLIRIWCTSCPG